MESMSALLSKWRQASAKMQKLAADTPRIIGKECVDVVKDNFRLQGYDSGQGVNEWEKRKPATDKAYDSGKTINSKGVQSKYRAGKNKTFKGSVYSSANPINLQTRNLFNAVKYKALAKNVMIGVNEKLIPYAEGVNKLRKFMPEPSAPPNTKMLKRIKKKIEFERGKAMKDFVKYK